MPMLAPDDLALGHPVMDRDHALSLALWEAAKAAPAGALAAPFAAFAQHLRDHFDHENTLMTDRGFFALPCHRGEHDRVLGQIAAVGAEIAAGREDAARTYLTLQFPDWFHGHLATMDRVTAAFLVSTD